MYDILNKYSVYFKTSWRKGKGAKVSKILRLPLVYFRNQSFKSNDKHKYSSPKPITYILGEYVSMVTCFNVKVKSKSYISTHCVSSTLNKSWDHIKMKNYLVKNYIEIHITFILCNGFMQRARQRNILSPSPLRIPSCWVL